MKLEQFYVAAPFELRDQARLLRDAVQATGRVCTASWIDEPAGQDDAQGALIDLRDIDDADVLILLNPEGWERRGTGGRHVETGYALASIGRVAIVGVRSNIFHHLGEDVVDVFATTEELLAWLD